MKEIAYLLIFSVFILVLVGGTAYLVAYKNLSPWLFLLDLVLIAILRNKSLIEIGVTENEETR